MGQTSTHNYSGNLTLTAADPTIFDSGDPLLVALGAAAGEVVVAGAADAIGVFQERLQGGDGNNAQVNVRLLNAGGTIRVKTGGAIAYGAAVSATTGGLAVTGTANLIGTYFGPDAGDGDIIEIITNPAATSV